MFETKKTFIIEEVEAQDSQDVEKKNIKVQQPKVENADDNQLLRVCPKCNKNTLKIENGCNSCINPECGYGKCDV